MSRDQRRAAMEAKAVNNVVVRPYGENSNMGEKEFKMGGKGDKKMADKIAADKIAADKIEKDKMGKDKQVKAQPMRNEKQLKHAAANNSKDEVKVVWTMEGAEEEMKKNPDAHVVTRSHKVCYMKIWVILGCVVVIG